MERLTHERSNGIKTGAWSPNKKQELVDRLAEYERTGLTPEEFEELKELAEKQAIKLLRAKDYVVVKWTREMEVDADECEEMEVSGKNKDCAGCSCSICLIQ